MQYTSFPSIIKLFMFTIIEIGTLKISPLKTFLQIDVAYKNKTHNLLPSIAIVFSFFFPFFFIIIT